MNSEEAREKDAGAEPASPPAEPQARALEVSRTARYYTLGGGEGDPGASSLREVWFVLHGYGQLARFFIRHAAPLAGPERLVVAPEALSRFYLRGTGLGEDRRIGASWMTSEDRLREMDDYVAYLDALREDVAARWPLGAADAHVLGFSQGVATACRWIARGTVAPQRLIAWAGEIPPELDLDALRGLRLRLVHGSDDEYVTPERVKAQRKRLREGGLAFETLRFSGGHQLDAETLRALANDEVSS